LSVDVFSRELLLKFINHKFKGERSKINEKFCSIVKYNNDEKTLRLTNEVLSFNLTPFETCIFESLDKGLEDKYYVFSERIKMVLNDEKNKVPYNLTQSFSINPFEIGEYTLKVDEKNELMFYAMIKNLIQKTKVKQIFIHRLDELILYFKNELFKFAKINQINLGLDELEFNQFIAPKAINHYLLASEINKNSHYSKKDFFSDSLFFEEKEASILYDAVTTNTGFIKTSTSNLIFEFKVPKFHFSYSGSDFIELNMIIGRNSISEKNLNLSDPSSYILTSHIAFGTEFGFFYGDRWSNISSCMVDILQCDLELIDNVILVKPSEITTTKVLI
jgi:hypothetical protein